MPIELACPKCRQSLQAIDCGSAPTHCPACGIRMSCPHCGSILESYPQQPDLFHCSECETDLGGDETGIFRPTPEGITSQVLSLAGFELKAELGHGGMGIVYRARQLSLNRDVALKVLSPALAGDKDLLDRFRNEAAVAASLLDSHILPVYDIQEVEGLPVIVMPLIEGTDLGRIVRDRAMAKQGKASADQHRWAPLDDKAYLQNVLPLLDQLVAAVTALHRGKVLHRDIKPSNVLVDRQTNIWLSDFGLSRLAEQGVGTRTGEGMGTPGYMSPEQARGEDAADFRSDLFSLGATLYQAVTLELPYGKRIGAASARPILPSRRQPLVPRDFDAVLLKALELEPSERYASAADLQEDWQRVRQGLLPRARVAGPLTKASRAVRRHPWQAAAGVAVVALLAVVAALLYTATGSAPLGASSVDKTIYRTVVLETEPSGAKVGLVPLHQDYGFPLPDQAIRPEGTTPNTIEKVPAGEYLVVAEIPGRGFHEVYRMVPKPGQLPERNFDHRQWDQVDEDKIHWPKITIPVNQVNKAMARFQGGEFTMGGKDVPGSPPHPRTIPSFYLDTTEVTVGAFRAEYKGSPLPQELMARPPPDTFAITFVTFDQALAYAERVGKRLPDEAEYEYAATAGGKQRFPWGDDASKIVSWPIDEVRKPAFDRTATDPPVYGLFSNVAEWTTSWHSLYPGTHPDMVMRFAVQPALLSFNGSIIVRGGMPSVVEGHANVNAKEIDMGYCEPRFRHSYSRYVAKPGLGFRCARSAKTRYLTPE